jgi:hypothetical protein
MMDSHQAWPAASAFLKWVKQYDQGIKNGIYAQMIGGYGVRAMYVVRFVRYLQGGDAECEAARAVLIELLGGTDWLGQSAEKIASMLLEDGEHDLLQRGVHGIWDAVSSMTTVESSISPCRSESDVAEVVKWMYVLVARHISEKQDLWHKESISIAADHMRISLDDYVHKAVAWWQYDPWTVIRVKGRKAPVGMSIVLPLTDAAYNSLRSGNRMSYDIRPEELRRPSPNLLVEMVGERLPLVGGEAGNHTRSTLIAALSQQAILSNPHRDRARGRFRMLSFAGTPANRDRIMSFGFRPTSVCMPNTNIDWMEKDWGRQMSFSDYVYLGLLMALGGDPNCRLVPPMMTK